MVNFKIQLHLIFDSLQNTLLSLLYYKVFIYQLLVGFSFQTARKRMFLVQVLNSIHNSKRARTFILPCSYRNRI